ncbi:alcohol dehydrogenase [Vararia minispora EC-137]|uniref:Alcohol dehydrogenase n=1 Tax=Vararia minispora EC-137 TaxID=1314806 RepID=A0ACB8QWW1_9AGAM|nr:alcohol dehydrogenase [Vararia minispora EC-137]
MKYDDTPTVDLDEEPLYGSILVKTLALSIDPYMRIQMRDSNIKTYVPPFIVGEPMAGHGIGVVVRSEHPDFAAGDRVTSGLFPHQEYFVDDLKREYFPTKKVPSDSAIAPSLYLGILGITGATAYTSWKEYARPRKGQTAFVTSAAGGVGSVIVQLAKMDGMKVIASSGSDEKAEFVKELGADISFNYRTTSTEEILQREGPIDLYYDNVGEETLDLALKYASTHANFIMSGMISSYNKPDKSYAFKARTIANMFEIIAKEIRLQGFLFTSLIGRWEMQFFEEIPALIKHGKLKTLEDRSYGLQNIGDALLAVNMGENFGKKVVIVTEE